jgi:hypothetical protein
LPMRATFFHFSWLNYYKEIQDNLLSSIIHFSPSANRA